MLEMQMLKLTEKCMHLPKLVAGICIMCFCASLSIQEAMKALVLLWDGLVRHDAPSS